MAKFAPAVLVATLLLCTGCEPPPLPEQEARFKGLIENHFSTENKDAELRRTNLRMEIAQHRENPTTSPPSGTVLSTFKFDANGWIIYEVGCPVCKTKHTIEYTGSAQYCGTCGGMTEPTKDSKQWLPLVEAGLAGDQLKDRGLTAVPMYELTKNNVEEPLEAVVRYFRFSSAYDPRAVVNVSNKIIADEGIATEVLPGGGKVPPGMHRPGEVFVGEMKFTYSGGHTQHESTKPEVAVKPWKTLRPTGSN